ncbi:hypothetical protein CLV51_1021199 [Chitinophaga niastensis]|uniref:Nucleotide-diphospho-sugar transferase n=1 Tax=Chitinophaga niastensis TaxID=536980 RepID=A0A2P8HQ51_CHINA|nr:nucleotide-diphospho-sugar transferase [Chitinophaga niastensis]PSL48332.1 hypothetical protein CLV51_1021199 [Chitinophaga niastensis]
MTNYNVQSPILFIIFNRPDVTRQVFEKIKAVKPARLYIAADGPRKGHATDARRCEEARAAVAGIDWECTVKTLFREENKGCKLAVSGAISWFFEQEEEGIILEDDCVPNNSFFYFCDTMLNKYRHDTRIRNITGNNLQHGKTWGTGSYYFSQLSNIWGWASWRRVWKEYDVTMSKYTEEDVVAQLPKICDDRFFVLEWLGFFKNVKAGKIDTWDYQLQFNTFFENGLCVTPNVNLVSNIGFGVDATHTILSDAHNANLPVAELGEITHPHIMLPEKAADYYFLNSEFNLAAKWRRYNKPKRRIKRWLKSFFAK